MVNLGELTKLLEQGFAEGEYTYSSDDGDFRFKLRTITPKAEVDATRDAERAFAESGTKDEAAMNVFNAIEILSRSIESVNGQPLDKIPGARGETPLDQKRSVIENLSQKLLLDLWKKYQDVSAGTTLTGTDEESEAVKK